MYGLKQATKCWNDILTNIMRAIKGNELIVGAYVDDLLIISSSEQVIANFKKTFPKVLEILTKELFQDSLVSISYVVEKNFTMVFD